MPDDEVYLELIRKAPELAAAGATRVQYGELVIDFRPVYEVEEDEDDVSTPGGDRLAGCRFAEDRFPEAGVPAEERLTLTDFPEESEMPKSEGDPLFAHLDPEERPE